MAWWFQVEPGGGGGGNRGRMGGELGKKAGPESNELSVHVRQFREILETRNNSNG